MFIFESLRFYNQKTKSQTKSKIETFAYVWLETSHDLSVVVQGVPKSGFYILDLLVTYNVVLVVKKKLTFFTTRVET